MTTIQTGIATTREQGAAGLLADALSYARQGWLVLPLHTPAQGGCSCGHSCGSVGKHPRTAHGVYDASRDPAVLHAWWRRWPTANVGVATGGPSGIVVLDFDPAHGGLQNLERLQNQVGPLPETLMACSGSGGLHLYFHWPNELGKAQNAVGLAKHSGVDVRADGGFIVAPPSQHASEARYTWLSWGMRPAPLPERWVRLLTERHEQPTRKPGLAGLDSTTLPERWLAGAARLARPGQRNALGYWLACRLIEAGVERLEAEAVMRRYAALVGGLDQAPYTEEEALASYRSAARAARV